MQPEQKKYIQLEGKLRTFVLGFGLSQRKFEVCSDCFG